MKMEGIELYPHNQKAYDNLNGGRAFNTLWKIIPMQR